MDSKTEQFRFVGCTQPDTIIGERVVLRQSVTTPALDANGRISLIDFQQFFIDLTVSVRQRYGQDCANFELEFASDGGIWVIFTRPMDVVETTQIRAYRQRQLQGQASSELSDDDVISRHARTAPTRSLPDPSVAAHGPLLPA